MDITVKWFSYIVAVTQSEHYRIAMDVEVLKIKTSQSS